ncbi:MAG: hypothetical protein ABSA48_07550 [Terracidiphilus sp.]
MREKGDDAGENRHEEKRPFFKAQLPLRKEPLFSRFPRERYSAQRPIIEQEQSKGKRDDHWFRHQAAGKGADDQCVPFPGWIAHIPCIGKQSREPEERAQDILAFRDPGNGFDVRGMQCEKKCDHRGTPDETRHIQEQKKKQNRIGGVQAQIGHMVTAGIFAIKLPVDHVGDPRQRVPVGRMEGCKCPLDALRGYPLLHVAVLHDIVVIVQRNEIVAPHAAVAKCGDHHEDDTNGDNLPRLGGYGRNGRSLSGRRFRRALALDFALSRFLRHDWQSPIILKTAGLDTSGL